VAEGLLSMDKLLEVFLHLGEELMIL
jgi:hypothetical protein